MKFIGNRREAFNQDKNSLCTAPTRTTYTNSFKKSIWLNETKESFLSSIQNPPINIESSQTLTKKDNNENIEDCSDKSINEIFMKFTNNTNLIKTEIKMLNKLY